MVPCYYPAYSGASIAMAADDNRLVIGGRLDSSYRGHVTVYAGEFRVYEFDGNNWNPLGQQIIGTPGDRLEESVVISGDAVSSPQSDENCSNAGKVVVYQYSDVEGRVNYYAGMSRVHELSGVGDGLNGAINSCL